jgi:2-methylcitrate dehydratase PrpD
MPAATAAETLAGFAAALRYEDIPADVLDRARACIIDTVAVATYGARFEWSAGIARYAERYGTGGPCTVFGRSGARLHAPFAALANGAFAHAFEQDSLRYPGAGVHPGATLLPAALALAQETGASGKELLVAFVAGCEVLFRIGAASRHSSEGLGFHAPGLTGPYGAAIAAGRVMRLDAPRLADALGIAGSLSSGLLAFTKAARGSQVKKLHLGRAAESGVLAARLAAEGINGPETVLEGRSGFLEAYCREPDPGRLVSGLGSEWETRKICLKSFPCHVMAHTPIRALRALMAEHKFAPRDVEEILVEGAPKLLTHHGLAAPRDVMQAQYSVPFCVALALYRNPADPDSFDETAIADRDIRAACARVRLASLPADFKPRSSWHARVQVVLRSSKRLLRDSPSFEGMPEEPMGPESLRAKFYLLTRDLGDSDSRSLFEKYARLEEQANLA